LKGECEGGLTIYLAAPLFSQSERRWNRELARGLEGELSCRVILPQDFGDGAWQGEREGRAALFRLCLEGVEQCDAMVAILDGPDADSGTAFEMGYAYALKKPIVGVRTDYREHQERGTNLMLARCSGGFVRLLVQEENVAELVSAISKELGRVVRERDPAP
jgi:nucleoside 2-deoxyribosyltransferase